MDEPPSFNLLTSFDQGLLYYLVTAVLLLVSAFASAIEAAFFSIESDVLDRLRKSNDRREKLVVELLVHPRLLLSALTTIKYVAVIGSAVLLAVEVLLDGSLGQLFLRGTVPPGVLLVLSFALFGIILPKIYGAANNVSLARKSSVMCKNLTVVFKPFISPLLRMSERVQKKMESITEQNSVKELSHALQLATVEDEPREGEKEILAGIVNFGTLTVKLIMRPRGEISYTDVDHNFHQLLEFVRRSGYARIPVCRNSLDKIEGILYIKDLLPFLDEGPEFQWQKLLRPGYFVPELKKLDALLKDFQEKRVHMALVVGEQGAISGLITLEDVIEQIIGDINDEFDEVGTPYQKLTANSFLFDGKVSVQEFCRITQIDPSLIQPIKGINESISGLIMEATGKLPSVGEKIIIEPFTFVVESVDQKRVKKVKVLVNEANEK